jgi:aconitase A
MAHNLHKTLKEFDSGSGKGKFYSLPQLGKALNIKIDRLPVSIRIVLESVLRNYDGKKIAEEHITQLANWKPTASRVDEIPFVVSRVVSRNAPARTRSRSNRWSRLIWWSITRCRSITSVKRMHSI